MTELKQNVLDALDELLDSDELLDDEWTRVNKLYHQFEDALDDDAMEELED